MITPPLPNQPQRSQYFEFLPTEELRIDRVSWHIAGIVIDNPSDTWLIIYPIRRFVPPRTLMWTSDLPPTTTMVRILSIAAPTGGLASVVTGGPIGVTVFDTYVGYSTGLPYDVQSNINNIYNNIVGPDHIHTYPGPWTAYTSAWTTAAGTPPAIGNGSIIARYKLMDIDTCAINIQLTGGTTTVWGSGSNQWRMSLPFVARPTYGEQVMVSEIHDSGVDRKPAIARIPAGLTTIEQFIHDRTGFQVSNNQPQVWAGSDQLITTGMYEIVPITPPPDPATLPPSPEISPVTCAVRGSYGESTELPPEWAVGDLAIALAQNGTSSAPSLPGSGWVQIGVDNRGGGSSRIGYRILVAGDTDSGNWVGASNVSVALLQGFIVGTPIGSSAVAGGSSGAQIPSLSLVKTDGSSAVLAMGSIVRGSSPYGYQAQASSMVNHSDPCMLPTPSGVSNLGASPSQFVLLATQQVSWGSRFTTPDGSYRIWAVEIRST